MIILSLIGDLTMSQNAFEWEIYHRDREHARECGDPLLGTVLALTKDEAVAMAIAGQWNQPPQGMLVAPSGLWVVQRLGATRPH